MLLNVAVNGDLDPNTIDAVFGHAHTYRPYTADRAESVQAVAVIPDNTTLVDPDYWDYNEFQSTSSDYDKFDLTLTKVIFNLYLVSCCN